MGRQHDPDLLEQLVRAAERVADHAIEARTPPHRLIFNLARELRTTDGAVEAVARDPEIIFEPVAACCRILHAHPADYRDVDWSEAAHRDVFVQVLVTWPKIRARGQGALAAAVAEARCAPISILGPLVAYGPTFVIVASTGYHLQQYKGDADIFLPCRALGIEIGVHYSRIAHHLNMATAAGLVRLTQPATLVPKPRAACYRFEFECPLYRPPCATADEDEVRLRMNGRTREPGEDDVENEVPF